MRGRPYIFNNLGGGVNKEAAPYAISESEARNSVNWHTSPSGIIRKRFGSPAFSTPVVGGGNSLTSLFALHTTTRWLVGAGGTKLFKINTAGVSADLATGLSANAKWNFVQAPAIGAQGPLYGVNGSNTPQQWDGVAASAGNWIKTGVAAVPNGTMIEYHNNRVSIIGVAGTPSRQYLSKLLDPTIWDSPDAITVDYETSDGQDLTAQGHVGPYMLLFKPRKIYVLTNSDLGSFRSLSSEVGCVANRSVIETPNGTIFLATDGSIYMTDGSSLTDISEGLRPLLRSIPATALTNASAFYKNNSYYLSIAESTTDNTLVLEYDTQTRTWWPHRINTAASTTTGINDWALLEPSSTATLYGAISGSTAPQIAEMFKDNTFQDLGAFNYTCQWDGPWHVFDQPHIDKQVQEIRVDGLGQYNLYTARNFASTLNAEEQTQWEVADPGTTFGGSGTFGGAGVFGDTPTVIESRFYTPGVARAWSLRFESINNQDCQIYAYTCSIDHRTD